MPRLEAFKPEMIFVSAGFDAHRDDDMGQLGLTEQDYTWITMRIKDVARRFANKRIVSCLEGGYVLSPLARSVGAHVKVLIGADFPFLGLPLSAKPETTEPIPFFPASD
jgi:acetoin utilization deacetylase AcuC-like enzyme